MQGSSELMSTSTAAVIGTADFGCFWVSASQQQYDVFCVLLGYLYLFRNSCSDFLLPLIDQWCGRACNTLGWRGAAWGVCMLGYLVWEGDKGCRDLAPGRCWAGWSSAGRLLAGGHWQCCTPGRVLVCVSKGERGDVQRSAVQWHV